MPSPPNPLDLATARRRLAGSHGREYWRSLEELADTEGFREMLQREFPRFAAEWNGPVERRRFLQLMGASLALAGLTGCTRQPAEEITPYVRQPEAILPGRPLHYASTMTLGGYATGVLVETHEGRPTKIEGNPGHPASLGASDVFMQASLLGLYDPDRSQTVTYLGEIRTWSAFLGAMRGAMSAQRALKGAGLRVLTETVTSPTLAAQIRSILDELPEARWHQYEPANRDNVHAGARLAFGRPVQPIYRFDRAKLVVSLDADFLGGGPGHLRYTRDFLSRRRLDGGVAEASRLYVVEASPTITGAKAEHRLLVPPSRVHAVALDLAARMGVADSAPETGHGKWITALTDDLRQHRGSSLVIAGETQPPAVHALAHALNEALGNHGNTVVYTDPVEANPVDQSASLRELVQEMNDGKVDLLVMAGGNPVYNAPADLAFGEALTRVDLRAHLGAHNDETSELCQWHVPEAHYLEAWGDARAYDGTASIVQPVIRPLYNGRSAHELLAALTERPDVAALDLLRDHWQAAGSGAGDFEREWRVALHDGSIAGTAAAPIDVTVDRAAVASSKPLETPRGLEIAFRQDPAVHDGRFANNGWLQELPRPLTKLTWDNAAMVSVTTAGELGVKVGFGSRGGEHGEALSDMVELSYRGRSLRVPVWIVPDHPDGSVTLHLGYGRTRAGNVGNGAGSNAYAMRTSDAPWSGGGLEVSPTGERFTLANTQGHWNMEGRDLIRSGSLERYHARPDLAPPHAHPEPGDEMSMFPPHDYPGYAWGMAIDLNACTGCNACVVACQAENNIPVVGRDQVGAGREMHWLRVDRYHKGDPEHPDDLETYFQPVPCQHCENAPCEVVCPVAATVHSAEGLNDMVYNRCVGTRYCANNCPYKVRRFNFFLYQDWESPSLKAMRNPDVSVRSRGVMEKCTYCVQRINRGKIQAELEDREVRDGEITTACEQACPARAISFGNVNDPDSRVSRLKAEDRNYSLLAGVNTRPRTTYLGAVRDWNPTLKAEAEDDHGDTHHES